MIVIKLAELLSARWFPLSTNLGRANQSKVALHCAGRYRGRGYTNKIQQYRELPHLFLVVNTLKDF